MPESQKPRSSAVVDSVIPVEEEEHRILNAQATELTVEVIPVAERNHGGAKRTIGTAEHTIPQIVVCQAPLGEFANNAILIPLALWSG
jgi:hypothetical protein